MKIQRNYGIKLLYLFFIINVFMCILVNVDCSISGMIAPIEVVEEWGCRDTEIRLTCGPLESKIAILDATFTPDCSNSEADNCDNLYDTRLMGIYIPTKIHLRNEEKVAGKKFLETLRKAPDDVYLSDEPDDENGLNDEQTDILSKEEKVSLKESLEALIVKYLRKLSPDDYNDEDYLNNRNRRTTTTTTNETEYDNFNYTDIEIDPTSTDDGNNNKTTFDYNDDDVEDVENLKINNHNSNAIERIIVTPPNNLTKHDHSGDSVVKTKTVKTKKVQGDNKICSIRNSRQTQLDRFELDKSINYDFKNDVNIRAAVAHRCSGINHCSFVFGTDHPYSVIWDSGTVRIKYICMDDFRVNKYCAERLIIGNEIELNENEFNLNARYFSQNKIYTKPQGEPVAEARIQHDQQFHQFTNVKIIKAAPDDSTVEEQFVKPNVENEKLLSENENRRKQRVYSQDFKILKILPKELDNFNTIAQIGDEYYFKKDESNNIDQDSTATKQLSNENLSEINKASTNIPIVMPPQPPLIIKDSDVIILPTIIIDKIDLDILPKTNESYLDNFNDKLMTPYQINTITSTITKTSNSVTVATPKIPQDANEMDSNNKNEFPIISNENGDTHLITPSTSLDDANEKSYYENEIYTGAEEENTINYRNELYNRNNNISNKNSIIFNVSDNISTNNDNVIEHLDADSTNLNKNEKIVDNDKSVINTNFNDIDDDDDDDDGDDDEYDISYEEDDYFSTYAARRKTKYQSVQRIALGKPLVQGFAMSPGYPKFYIGESNCEWTIFAPYDQKIRLTFLDISVRTADPLCHDYIEVVDVEQNYVLFNSCSELTKPRDIISESNQLKINFRTTTRFMFPKRGILFHYSALGCLTPPTPLNSKLLSRTEDRAKYICDSSFVFPDTAVPIRELVCIERHTWDNILPDCIAKVAAEGSGLVQHIDYNKKEASSMVDKTDTLYDIIIPTFLMAALFIVNGIVFVIIMRYRNKRRENFDNELAEL